MKPTLKDAYATIALLAATWPKAFSVEFAGRRPLAVGIGKAIAAASEGAITPEELDAALRIYTGTKPYLKKLKQGTERVDLDGNSAGVVTAEQATNAKHRIERIDERNSARVRAHAFAEGAKAIKAKAEAERAAEQAKCAAEDAKRVASGRKPVLRLPRQRMAGSAVAPAWRENDLSDEDGGSPFDVSAIRGSQGTACRWHLR